MVISIQPTIPFFEGNGYDTWSIKMRTLFISEDLWELVDKGYVEEEIPRDAMRDVRKNDAKALFFIQQAISESIFPQISKAMKSKEAWDSLQTKYQSTSLDAAQDGDGSQTDIPLMDDSVYEAAAKGDIEALKKIPESEFHAQLSPKHNTILHIASEFAREGHLKVVEALINAARKPTLDIETGPGPHKVMLRMKNKGKDTALHEAVRYGNREVVKLLIKEDPDLVYGANDSGITPLYMAAEGRFRAIVEIIIDESKETGTSPPYIGGLFLIVR
ncbi:ankyrin repeat-containing protein ITN1 isoform X3 [Vitis vinifera]|uniref:ankyrin repeat-containing protein ITN1 isoform X3 n=1 Tax=Vitis vinifera TaxID=29760 RepID=UPI002882E549|nr:ankyrin repeat-containing protein ITN1 isoform X3 [Vitis vinifera]